MAYEHKPNTGTMFPNTNKKSDAAPDWRGEINLDGKLIKLAGWMTDSKTGTKYMKLKKDDYVPQQQPASPGPDLPF